MGILTDWQIEELAGSGAIVPWTDNKKREGKISHGLSSYGYDARIGYRFKVFTPALCAVIDPKNFNHDSFVDIDLSPEEGKTKADHILIPPNSFALGETIEEFNIPRDCLAIVLGKSTYARCGIITNVTPLEPEWKGKVTVEISNTAPCPAKVYVGEGIMQVLFFRSDGVTEAILWQLTQLIALSPGGESMLKMFYDQIQRPMFSTVSPIRLYPRGTCRTSYADKGGKYQSQPGLTLPKVD